MERMEVYLDPTHGGPFVLDKGIMPSIAQLRLRAII
jgi:hypothetical protein